MPGIYGIRQGDNKKKPKPGGKGRIICVVTGQMQKDITGLRDQFTK